MSKVVPMLVDVAQQSHVACAGGSFGQRLDWLKAQTGCSLSEATKAFADLYAMETAEPDWLAALTVDFSKISLGDCRLRRCCIAQDSESRAALLTCAPENVEGQQLAELVLQGARMAQVRRVLVTEPDFELLLGRAERGTRAMRSVSEGLQDPVEQETSGLLQLSLVGIEQTTNPIVRLVDATLYDALRVGASDIHFEIQQKGLTIKYRLDGVLQEFARVEGLETANQVISRIKVLADLDISERRIPQDGRFRALAERREIDFRVSIMPNAVAEDAVLRILDRKHLTGQFDRLTLDSLQLEAHIKGFIRHAASLPYGLLLVTGPTGSGKTTTLYAAITEIHSGLDKIITIEDPIEYQLNGILQIPVNEKKGLTFAKGLRSVLRHDPDKIMVGEIRDSETAQIAVQAALTGHQVFTTVHANNVFDVIGRFTNMGVDSYSLVAALTGIMAQRLIRKVCPHCAQQRETSEEEALQFRNHDPALEAPARLVSPSGCTECRHTGYKGRAVIAETLYIDDELKDLLAQQAPVSTVKAAAQRKGFRNLRTCALGLAGMGQTTMQEVNRVVPVQ